MNCFQIDFIDAKRQYPLRLPATIFALELVSKRARTIYLQDRRYVTDPWPAQIMWILHVLELFHEPHQANYIERLKRDQTIIGRHSCDYSRPDPLIWTLDFARRN